LGGPRPTIMTSGGNDRLRMKGKNLTKGYKAKRKKRTKDIALKYLKEFWYIVGRLRAKL